MPETLLADSLVRSVQVGCLYALMALGLTLTLAVIRLPNFAHAELITAGAYVALLSSLSFSSSLPQILALAFIGSAVLALLIHWLVYRPLSRRNVSTYSLLLASFAAGLIVRYLIFLYVDRFDLFDKRIQVPLEIVYERRPYILTNVFTLSVPAALGLIVVLSLLLKFTPIGRDLRALADNLILARVVGIPMERLHVFTWLLAGGLAGVGGALWGLYTSVNPLMGWLTILSVFAATVLGGMTSLTGTIIGAFVVSFSENLLMQWLNFRYDLDFTYKPAVPFVIIILAFLLRPPDLRGLFARLSAPARSRRKAT